MRSTAKLFAGMLIVGWLWVAGWAWSHPMPRADLEPIELDYRINVNKADAARLQLLPGIGPGIARRVVHVRRRIGRFASPADLERVNYIGPMVRRRVTPWVRFTPRDGDATPR